MKIQKIEIKNFRGFYDMVLELNGESAILVGKNGAGKSSLLDAAAVLFSRFASRVANTRTPHRSLNDSDISYGEEESTLRIEVEHANEAIRWGVYRSKQRGFKYLSANAMNAMVHTLHEKVQTFEGTGIPITIYYPVNRTVLDTPLQASEKYDFDQFSAFEKALTSGTDFRLFFEWYRNREDLENEQKIRKQNLKHEDFQLRAVRTAIQKFLPGFSNLRVMRDPLQLVIDKGDKSLEINQLSDGEKCMLALVGDLARRLALANPNRTNPLLGEGIVMIDEIELHLHPEWQREIIPSLEETFPNVQFLLSTHSPQVLGEIRTMRIFLLEVEDGGSRLTPYQSVFGKDSNRILEDVMGGTSRDRGVKCKLNELFDAITNSQWEEVHRIKQQLEEQIGTDEPELVKAEVLIRRKRSLGK